MDKEQYLSFLKGDTWLSQLARFNVVYGDKPDSHVSRIIKDSFNYKAFTEDSDPYKHLETPFRDLANSVFSKEYYSYGLSPDTSGVDYGTRVLRDALDFSTTSAFDDELASGFRSSNRVIKKIFGHTFATDILGVEASQFDNARSSLFGSVFDRVEQSFGTAHTPLVDNENNNSAMYIPALEKQLTELASYDLMNSMDQYARVNLDLNNLNRETTVQEAMRSLGTGMLESYDSKGSLPSNVLDKFRYINRPGILPVVDMLNRAGGEITIDIYQLQNPTIRGYILGKITNAAINKEKLNVNIRMASSTDPSTSSTGYNILGPNIMMAKELSMINTLLLDDQAKSPADRVYGDVNINFQWTGKRSHAKLLMTDKGALVGTANFTEPMGESIFQAGYAFETVRQIKNTLSEENSKLIEYIESQTSLKINELILKNDITPDQARQVGLNAGYFNEVAQGLENLSLDLDSEAYLYLQTRYLNEYIKRGFRLPNRLGTMANLKDRPVGLGTAGDTYDLLKKALSEVDDTKSNRGGTRKFYGFLNQTFLLDLKPTNIDPDERKLLIEETQSKEAKNKYNGASLIRGEMGDESPETLADETFRNYIFQKQKVYQEEIQKPLFEAIINNKAKIIVDAHNYEEKILDPVYEQLLKDSRFTGEATYDIKRYVELLMKDSGLAERATAKQKVDALSRGIRLSSPFATALGGNRIESLAYQLLAITSDNIEKSIAPFSHAKMFGTVEFTPQFDTLQAEMKNADTNSIIQKAINEGAIRLVAGKVGSSNMGLYSMDAGDDLSANYSDLDQQYTNTELDILLDYTAFTKDKAEDKYGYLNEEKDFLKMLAQSMSALVTKTRLTSGLIYTDVDPRELYQKNLDRARLEQLYTSLDNLSEISKVGDTKLFKVSRVIDNSGIKELIVSTSTPRGPKSYRFTILKDSIANAGMYSVLAIDQGRIINRIAFANTSGIDINIGLSALDGTVNNDGTTIYKGRRVFLDPMESTTALISSLVLEKQQLQYIKNPLDFIKEAGGFEDFLVDSPDKKITRLVNIFITQMMSVDLFANQTGGYSLKDTLNKLSNSPKRREMQNRASRNIERFLFEYGDKAGRSKSRASYIRELGGLGENDKVTEAYGEYGALLRQFLEFTKENPKVDFSSSTYYQSLVDRTAILLSDATNIDFIEFFVRAVGGSELDRQLNLRLQGVDKKLFETFLTPTQQRVYSATQSYDQLPLYGVSKQNTYAAGILNEAKGLGVNQLVRRAIMHLPFSFGPADYIGTGFTSFVKVAEGSGSKLGRSGRAYGKVNVLDFIEEGEAKTGTIYDMAIIDEARVGVMVRKDDMELYLKELEQSGVELPSLSSDLLSDIKEKEDMMREGKAFLIFNFAKLSQTSQRLKNALGARPLMNTSARYNAFLDVSYSEYLKDQPTAKSSSDRSYGFFKELVVNAYLKEITKDNTSVMEQIRKIEGERIDYAAMFSGSINTLLGPRALNLIREVEQEVESEYSDADEALKREIVRIRLINNELFGTTKGLIGGELIKSGKGKDAKYRSSVLLVALSGAYSDFAYSNPLYRYSNARDAMLAGGAGKANENDFFAEAKALQWKGPRTGFLDQATKSIKASLLALDLDVLKGSEGVFYTFDTELSSILKQGERAYFDFELGVAVIADANGGKRVINSRSELSVLKGAIHKSGNRVPTAGVVTAASNVTSAMGESGIEYMFATNFLDGSIHGNEIRKQIQYIRTQIGDARRLDSLGGGLFKAPIAPGSYEFWKQVADQLGISIGSTSTALNEGWDLDISQIFALGSMSNIKSYLLEHGSNLLTNERQNFIDILTKKNNNISIPAALLLSFNDNFLDGGIDKKNLYEKLFKKIETGAMGGTFQAMALTHVIKFNEGKIDTNLSVGESFFQSFRAANSNLNHLTSMRLNNPAIRNLFNAIADEGKNGVTQFTNQQVVDAIKDMLSLKDQVDEVYLGRSTKLSYLSNRERAIIASQLDIIMQLTQTKTLSNVPLMPKFSGKRTSEKDYAFQTVKAIMGFSTDKEMEEYQETYMEVLSNQHAVLRLYVTASPSQSKVATSKKATANIELQELLERNFLATASTFEKGDRVSNIREHVAEIYALMTGMSKSQFQNAYTGEILDLITLDVVGATEKTTLASDLMVKSLAFHQNPNYKNSDLMAKVRGLSAFAYFSDEQAKRLALRIMRSNAVRRVIRNQDLSIDEAALEISRLMTPQRVASGSDDYIENREVRLELFKAVVSARRKSTGTHLGRSLIKHLKEEMFSTINDLRAENLPYLLDPNESVLTKAETVVSTLIKNNFSSGSVMFPTFEPARGRGAALGNVKVKADFTNLNYGIILGPKAIRALGEQFGGFQSELAASALSLYKALDPDSVVFQALNKFRETYSLNVADGFNPETLEVDLTQQQAVALMGYQDEVKNFYQLAARELSGRYIQEIMGNRVRAKGSTLVGIASFYVGQREAVIPDIFNTKFDVIADKDPRMSLARKIAATTNNEIDFSDTYIENDLARKLNNSAINALIDGISNKAGVIEFVKTQSKAIQEQIRESLDPGKNDFTGDNLTDFHLRVGNIEEKLNHFKTYIDYLDFNGKGDAYLKYLTKAEYHYLDALFKKHHYHHRIKQYDFAAVGERQKAIKTLQKLDQVKDLVIFNGFLGTPSTRPETDADKARLQPSQLEGRLGGNGLDVKTEANLKVFGKSALDLRNYLDSLKASASSATERILTGLTDVIDEDAKDKINSLNKSRETFIKRLDQKIEALNSMPAHGRVSQSMIQDLKLDILQYISNSNAGEYNFKRSPPPGYLHLSATGNIQAITIEEINDRMEQDYGIPLFQDVSINKSLGIFNPISYLAPNLGDFDGDTMSGVMLGLAELELEKANLESKNASIRPNISSVTASIKANNYSIESIINFKKAADKNRINKNQKQFDDNAKRISQVDSLINEYKDINGYQEFESNLRNWVADYTKLGRDIVDTYSTGEVLTFVTQTKGLFPNLERAYSKNKDITDGIDLEFDRLGVSNGQQLVNLIENLNEGSISQSLLNTIFRNLSDAERAELSKLDSAKRIKGFLGAKVAENANIADSLKKFSQLAQGQGISEIDMDLFNAMLGKAGSYLLGQTYNNTIGLLYEKSPLLTIASSLENNVNKSNFETLLRSNSDLRNTLFNIYGIQGEDRLKIDPAGGSVPAVEISETDRLMEVMQSSAKNVKASVDTLGSVIQNIHQLMRDSIKLKSEAKGVQYIGDLVKRYEGTDSEEARNAIIDELSRGLEVQPLYYLDELMKGLKDMNVELNTDFHSKKQDPLDLEENLEEADKATRDAIDRLTSVFGLDEAALEKRLNVLQSRVSDPSMKDYMAQIEKDTNIKSGGLLATYETKNAIVGMITEFAISNVSYENNAALTADLNNRIVTSKASTIGDRRERNRIILTPEGRFRGMQDSKRIAIEALASIDLTTDTVDNVDSIEQKEFIEYLKTKDNSETLFNNLFTDQDALGERVLVATQFYNTREAVNKVFGTFGEKFVALQAINATRTKITAADPGDLENYLLLNEDSAITQTMFQSLQTGKVQDPESMSAIFRSLVSIFASGGDYDANQVMRRTLDLVNESPTSRLSPEEGNFYEAISTILRADEAAEGNLANEMLDIVRATDFGQRVDTIGEIIKYYRPVEQTAEMNSTNAKNISITHKNTVKGLLSHYVGPDIARELDVQNDYKFNYNYFVEDNNSLVEKYLRNSIQSNIDSKVAKDVEAFGYKVGTGSALAEMAIFPLLSLVGGLMSAQSYGEGSTEALVEQTIGNSIMAFAYNQSSFSALGQSLSVGFKARMAARSGEDTLGNIGTLVVQETLAAAVFSMPKAFAAIEADIEGLDNKGISGVVKKTYSGVKQSAGVVGDYISDMVRTPVSAAIGIDLESYGKSALDYEENMYLKKATASTIYNIGAGAAVYSANAFINWFTKRGKATDADLANAMEERVGTPTVEEQSITQIVDNYTNVNNNTQIAQEPSETQMRNADGSPVAYTTEEYYDSGYYNQVSTYQQLDSGYEIVMGQTQFEDFSIAI